jgi:alpha-L-rhamnosidase
MAEVLGHKDDAEQYSKTMERIRPVIHRKFYDAEKQHYVYDEQAYYVMPLMTGVVPESLRPVIMKKLENCILKKNKGHLDTGMLGTYFMMEYLREVGRNDLVFTMFNKTSYPGWGYMLEQGATTLWEQWNGHWSRIHSCFTSPGNWFYQGLGGIQADPAAPGFKNVIIKPAFVGDLTWVKTHHDSPYGRVVSNWKREDDQITMEVTIPANSTATIHVPAKAASDVRVSGQALKKADQVTLLRMENGSAVLSVDSGQYSFGCKYTK